MPALGDSPQSLVAPPSWRAIDFISDLHLAEDTPRTLRAWADYLETTTADAVVILGDLFEAWVGDDARGEGFEAEAAALLAAAASRRWLGFMAGNRDFLVGQALLQDCGVTALADPTALTAFGERVLLSHGDALCIGDRAYQAFREVVRSPAWQHEFLRRPLAERRSVAREMRAESERRGSGRTPFHDVDPAAAMAVMQAAGATTLVHGHTHRPASETIDDRHRRHVLSDWDLDHAPTPRAEILRWQASGFTRLTPAQAAHPAS